MTIGKAILLTVFYILLGTVIQVALLSAIYLLDLEKEKYWILSEAGTILSMMISFYIFFKIFIKEKPIFKSDFNDLKSCGIYLLVFIAIGLFLFDKIFFDGYHYIFTDNFKIEKFKGKVYQFDYTQMIYLIFPLLLAPLFEEIIFRKYLFSKLLKKNSFITSVLVSSFCFSMIHLPNFRNILPTFIFGIIAAYLFYKSKNILYPIIMHFFGNLLWAIFKYYDKVVQVNFQEIKFSFLYWILTLGGLAIAMLAVKIFVQKTEKAET